MGRVDRGNYIPSLSQLVPQQAREPYPVQRYGTGCGSLPSYGSSNTCFKDKLINGFRRLADHLLNPYLTMPVAWPIPKRSAPYHLNTVPLTGLMPFPVRRHRCPIIHQLADVTILITACNELHFAESSLSGTPGFL